MNNNIESTGVFCKLCSDRTMQLYELQKLGAESREFQTVGRNKLEEVDGMENDGTPKVNIEYIVMETP